MLFLPQYILNELSRTERIIFSFKKCGILRMPKCFVISSVCEIKPRVDTSRLKFVIDFPAHIEVHWLEMFSYFLSLYLLDLFKFVS